MPSTVHTTMAASTDRIGGKPQYCMAQKAM